jgi:acetyl esterase/lipase
MYPQSVEYVAALKKSGRPVEFISVKNADHAFNFNYWTPEAQMAHKAMITYLDRYLKGN